jgi:hypothetical protein
LIPRNLLWAYPLALAAIGLSTLACRAQDAHATSQPATTTAAPDTYDTDPAADPARPTFTNPAHIPPPGYLQLEQGVLQANTTPPGPNHQFSVVQATKVALTHHIMLNFISQPYAHSVAGTEGSNDPGDLDFGVQYVIFDEGEGHSERPTVAVSYIERVRAGTSANLDVGDFSRSALVLASGDLFHLHYDTNLVFNEQPASDPNFAGHAPPRRVQFGQTFCETYSFNPKLALSAEIWHFTQPLTGGHAIGNLWALGYTPRKTLVFDAGFSRGLTSTSTHWETFVGFTYLLPHRLWPAHTA